MGKISHPSGVEELRRALALLDAVPPSPDLVRAATDAFREVFQHLRQQTAEHPDVAADILTRDLLPRCLIPDHEPDDSYGYRPSHTLGEWLDDLPEGYRDRVRRDALPRAITALGGAAVRNALRLIAAIGFWHDELLRALDELARSRADEVGDHALSALVGLGSRLEPVARDAYLGMLHRRISAGPNLHQYLCARSIGVPATAELVWVHWLEAPTPDPSPERRMLNSFGRSLLAEIAGRERNPAFTERVWGWLVESARRSDDGLDGVFSPNSSLVNRLDLPAVVPELVGRAARAEDRHRYLYYLRALECERPAHMPGWDQVPPADLAPVREDAVGPSGMVGRASTTEWHQKEAAWDVLLCRGERAALPPIRDVLVGERRYATHRLLELAGCVRLEPLPELVGALLAGVPGGNGWDEHELFAAQIGAIQAAHGSGTREAFDALLGYRQLGGGVLLSLVAAVAETARRLAAGGERVCVERLLELAEGAPGKDTRGAAAAAVAALIEDGVLTPPERGRAAALLHLPGTDDYARRELLFALTPLPPEDVPASAVGFATEILASEPTQEFPHPYPAALVLSARRPGAHSDPTFLAHHLGLTEQVESFAAGPQTLLGVVPHVVGRYFAAEPRRFAPAVAAILRGGDTGALGYVLPSVREAAGRIPRAVVDALIARLRQADHGWTAEPPVLHALAAVAPGRLVVDGCGGMSSWLPQLRVELADTLGQLAPLAPGLADARFEILARLAGDGTYAVRRAAYRAAAACEPERLVVLAEGWARWHDAGREGPRRYAAECAGWLPLAVEAARFSHLRSDQEPGVREAFERAIRERDDRHAASAFEARVLGVESPDEVVRQWRYGVGLALVGDDATVRRLNDRLQDGLPPSIRFWLARVRKAVERRWAVVTRKWPDPWAARPGHLERFSGVIRAEGGREAPVTGTLWQVPAEAPGGLSAWGGWGMSDGWSVRSGELVIPGRQPGRVLVTSSSIPSGEVVFSGNGPYPGNV